MEQRPTHAVVARFISALLPPNSDDVSLLYHLPQNHNYSFETCIAEQIVLSVTPSPAVYHDSIGICGNGASKGANGSTNGSNSRNNSNGARQGSEEPRPPRTIAFFHRPDELDRRRVRPDVLVLASDTSFDEHLTVGWNPALAQRLGIDVQTTLTVRGYNGDPGRKIGLIAPVDMILGPLLRSIEHEFGAIEHAQEGLSEEIHVVAMMNAFSSGHVHRVLDMAHEQGWVPSAEKSGRHVLYLTGDMRKSGLRAAKQTGMTVVCVGKTSAEQWGISYMASRLREAFPALLVKEVYEDELSDSEDCMKNSTTESSE